MIPFICGKCIIIISYRWMVKKCLEKTVENFKSPLGNFKVNILISCVFVLQSS